MVVRRHPEGSFRVLKVLLINGASGSGKTTLAKTLDDRLVGVSWVHPDELMDTPNMAAEDILKESLAHAGKQRPGSTIVIDCQIRPSAIDLLARSYSLESCEMVLLDCPRDIRERRLIDRGWSSQDFDQIDAWASILSDEARSAGFTIFDTSRVSVDAMADELERMLRDDA
ncbi:MAG: AAA family ATPase [Pseudomonadales bacterium]